MDEAKSTEDKPTFISPKKLKVYFNLVSVDEYNGGEMKEAKGKCTNENHGFHKLSRSANKPSRRNKRLPLTASSNDIPSTSEVVGGNFGNEENIPGGKQTENPPSSEKPKKGKRKLLTDDEISSIYIADENSPPHPPRQSVPRFSDYELFSGIPWTDEEFLPPKVQADRKSIVPANHVLNNFQKKYEKLNRLYDEGLSTKMDNKDKGKKDNTDEKNTKEEG